jgi:hypothetical protein
VALVFPVTKEDVALEQCPFLLRKRKKKLKTTCSLCAYQTRPSFWYEYLNKEKKRKKFKAMSAKSVANEWAFGAFFLLWPGRKRGGEKKARLPASSFT